MERITFSIVDVLDSLSGTPDYEVLHGVTPAAVTHWDLAELLGSGISLNGINRVLSKAKVKRASVGNDLCDGGGAGA